MATPNRTPGWRRHAPTVLIAAGFVVIFFVGPRTVLLAVILTGMFLRLSLKPEEINIYLAVLVSTHVATADSRLTRELGMVLVGAVLIALGAYFRHPTPLYYQYQGPSLREVLRLPLEGVKDLFSLIRRQWNTYGQEWASRGERLLRVVYLIVRIVMWLSGEEEDDPN